jgi:hypothetical protein
MNGTSCRPMHAMRCVLPKTDSFRPQFERDGFVAVPEALPVSLTRKWRQQAEEVKTHARTIFRGQSGFELAYKVVTGDDIRTYWPELFAFYNDRSGQFCSPKYELRGPQISLMLSRLSVI